MKKKAENFSTSLFWVRAGSYLARFSLPDEDKNLISQMLLMKAISISRCECAQKWIEKLKEKSAVWVW